MNDQQLILIFRLLHITFGVLWVGSVLNFVLFIRPTVNAMGPEGGKFMQRLGKTSFPAMMAISGLVTIVFGVLIMWKLSNGFQSGWFRTDYSRVLSAGSGLSIIAFIIGFAVNRPAADKINKISDAVTAAGGAPTSEQVSELSALKDRIFKSSNIIAVLLTLTVISMAICRYVG